MLKKILAGMLIGAISMLQIPFVSATDENYSQARAELINMSQGASYAEQLETIIPQLSTTRLMEIQSRVQDIKMTGAFASYQPLLNYIDISIELELQSRLLENNISPEEKAKAETEILAMQRMMGENMKDMMNNLMLSFIQASHYKEAGDFSMSMNLNIDEVNIESGIDFSDYIATSQMFDQQVQGEIEAFLKGIVDGESVDIQMETLIDFVSTEGNMYLLMENLKLIDGSSEKEFETLMKPFIEKMQELATSETYLAFEDADTQVLIDIFSNFSQENINAQIDTMLAKPLLEAYAKDGDTYILRPSQYFCDMGKTVSQVFDPFYDDETCSESQYRDMLSEMQEAGVSLSLTLEDENTLSLKIDNSTVLGFVSTVWRNDTLSYIESNMYDPNNPAINNMYFKFTPQESLVFDFLAEEAVDIQLEAMLGDSSQVTDLDMDMSIEDFFLMNIAYANNDLNASLNADFYGTSITCSAQGELSLEYMDIEEKCVIQSDDLSYMFPGEDTLTIHSDFQLDTRGEKNNISLAIDADTGNTEIMNLSIKNTGTRQSITPASIPAPSKTIPYMEAFPDTFSYDSFDDSGDSYDYDPSYITDPETGESLVCHEYEYNEEEDYDYCLKYVLDTYDYDDYYIIDENGEELYCEEYEYNEEENYDSCVNYIAE